MRRIVDTVCSSDAVPFGIVVTGARARRKNVTDTKLVGYATELLVERIRWFMQDLGGEAGIRMISDNVREGHRMEMERALGRPALRCATAQHTAGIEFVDSRSSIGIQVADALAYIINRRVGGDAAFEGMFRSIERKARSRGGRSGMRIGSGRRVE